MSQDNVQALPPGTRLGDYRLDAVIGHGGFGITYRAFDTQLAKFVAIKEYLPVEFAVRDRDGKVVPRGTRFADDFAWGRERFLDEARALARFRHPHIVPVLRYFEANDTAYTVMEFEDGKNLAELLREPQRRLPTDDVRRLADGLLNGLAAVHAQGFLHRDIKPSNVIVRRDGVPVLIDFGAARRAMGERTRTFTGVLTPQYAPIEQYAIDGKQGPWSDIYAAAAVLHHAIAGRPPPEAAARVGEDPYRPLAETLADRFDTTFLAAIDRGLAFAPAERPQSVKEWSAAFGLPLRRVEDAPTQRLAEPADNVPRLGGVSRPIDEAPPSAPPSRSIGRWAWVGLVVVAIAAVALWRLQPELGFELGAAPPSPEAPSAENAPAAEEAAAQPPAAQPPVPQAPVPQAPVPQAPVPQAPVPQAPAQPSPSQATAPAPPAPNASAQNTLVEQARRAAGEARTMLGRADEAARAARAMAGEARIVAARAAQPDLANAERLSYEAGANYVGQVSAGRRQGLGVANLANGERQIGEWEADRLNGLGTVQLADGTRYAGQWRDGQWTGLGVREKPGVEQAEGNFVGGRLDGLGVRRMLAEPNVVQYGEFRADALEGPGVETVGDRERYEGGFQGGKRNGYGQTTTDGKVVAGRWEAGKLVESAP